MKLPPAIEKTCARFDKMNLRERGLISFALLAAVVMIWDVAFMQPLDARQTSLTAEMDTLQQSITSAATAAEASAGSDPTTTALGKQKSVQSALDGVNEQLASASAGLVPPERMVELIHDVLSHQHDVHLVSLHNEPVKPLFTAEQSGGAQFGPYVHPVELVVEGRYLDIVDYLRALEQLPWRFRWKVLELATVEYPTNRVRIELSTLSMDKEWLGV